MTREPSELTAILQRIAEAQKVITRRKRSVQRAEHNLEEAEYLLAALEDERDEHLIAGWGDAPNWHAIFSAYEPTPALQAYRDKWVSTVPGLRTTGYNNIETRQAVFAICFETSTQAELMQTVRMVEFVMPYLHADSRGEKTMMIYNVPAQDCSHSFVFNTRTGQYGIGTDRYMHRDETQSFPSLEAALRHLQSMSDTDIVPEHQHELIGYTDRNSGGAE
ncbi:hypothetical protein [Citrobacter koseri]|uniref:hypothetical protein n=1 Tax=Citrobacter koseri TaxID=545 RepID=UPI0038923861